MNGAIWRFPLAGLLLLGGCSGSHGASIIPSTLSSSNRERVDARPQVRQNGTKPINWTRFAEPTTGFANSYAIAAGADGNVWYGNADGGLMRVQMSGATKLFALTYVNGTTTAKFIPSYGMAVGKDNNFYMSGTNYDSKNSKYVIGVASTSGSLKVHDIPSGDYGNDGALTLGPDGNVWFTEEAHIAKITTGGTITEYAYPDGSANNSYGGITTGPDGNIWFTNYNNGVIGKVTPSTGHITQYSVRTASVSCNPLGIAPASDGNLYFECTGNSLGQITTAGTATTFYDGFGVTTGYSSSMVEGPDGNPWFLDENNEYLSEFDPALTAFITYVPPYTGASIYDLVLGPDGNFWAASTDNKADVYIVNRLTVSPTSLTFTTIGKSANLTVTEPGTTKWTATATTPAVCGVTQGTAANTFVVKSAGVGTTTITIQDAIGNSFTIACKVT